MIKKVYVSGPIASLDEKGNHPSKGLMAQRRQRLTAVSRMITDRHEGRVEVINPIEISACTEGNAYCAGAYADGDHEWLCYLRHDLRELVMCHEIYMLEGWPWSPGACLEKLVSQKLMMIPYFWDDELDSARTSPIWRGRPRPDYINEYGDVHD